MPLHFLSAAATDAGPGDEVVLAGAEARHAAVVRRVRVGEAMTVGDGAGVWLTGECARVDAGEVVVRVVTREDVGRPRPTVMLVQALAKGDRDELAVQAATELGVDAVAPWQAARSVSRWEGAKLEKGRVKWEAIVREAVKQSHRAWLPEVHPALSTAALVALCAQRRVLVLEPGAASRLSGLDLTDERDVAVVVGPEGGIAPEELRALVQAGAEPVRLGESVLRTSTAGPAALALLNATLGRW